MPRPYEIRRFTYPEERATSNKWIKIYNKKYILNFDLKKIRTMLKYKENLNNVNKTIKKSVKKPVKNTKKVI